MPIGEELRDLILNGASTADLKQEAVNCGMHTLRASGLLRLKEGVTTIEEVLRNTVS